jgi:hypothetical protein
MADPGITQATQAEAIRPETNFKAGIIITPKRNISIVVRRELWPKAGFLDKEIWRRRRNLPDTSGSSGLIMLF